MPNLPPGCRYPSCSCTYPSCKERDYQVLVEAGHTPAKAAEIALDARRGDQHAIKWIKTLREQRS